MLSEGNIFPMSFCSLHMLQTSAISIMVKPVLSHAKSILQLATQFAHLTHQYTVIHQSPCRLDRLHIHIYARLKSRQSAAWRLIVLLRQPVLPI